MKKIFLSLLSLFTVITLVGCSSSNSEVANPIVEYNSLEEVDEKLDINIPQPKALGLSDQTYSIISDKIGQYSFKIDGVAYSIRAAHYANEYISGIYVDGKQVEELVDDNGYYENDNLKFVGWFISKSDDDLVLYELCAEDNGTIDKKSFLNFYYELTMMYLTDEVSERAQATSLQTGEDTFFISISWASSALDETQWMMNCTRSEDNSKLTYTNCTKTNISYNADGSILSQEEEYTNGSGYFTIQSNNKLAWDGASEEDCRTCVFVVNVQ